MVCLIDGKFECGYLVTATIGSKKLKGVLHEVPQNEVSQLSPTLQQYALSLLYQVFIVAVAGGGRDPRLEGEILLFQSLREPRITFSLLRSTQS